MSEERICKNCCMWDCDDIPCKENKALKPDGTDSCIAWGYFNKQEALIYRDGTIHTLESDKDWEP